MPLLCRALGEEPPEGAQGARTPGRDITQELLGENAARPPQQSAATECRGEDREGGRVIAVGRDAYGPCEFVVNPAFPHLPKALPLSFALAFHACIRPDPATRPTFDQVRFLNLQTTAAPPPSAVSLPGTGYGIRLVCRGDAWRGVTVATITCWCGWLHGHDV